MGRSISHISISNMTLLLFFSLPNVGFDVSCGPCNCAAFRARYASGDTWPQDSMARAIATVVVAAAPGPTRHTSLSPIAAWSRMDSYPGPVLLLMTVIGDPFICISQPCDHLHGVLPRRQ